MTDWLGLLVSVAILWAFAVVSPGPNFLITARIAITRSRRDGLRAVAGIGIGTVIWSAAGCFGVQALFIAVPWMYLTLKLMGGAYLIGMGALLIWRGGRDGDDGRSGSPSSGLKASAFQLGLLTTVTNPKSAIFVASIFATTMPAHPSMRLGLAVMVTMVAISVGWYCFVACVFTTRRLAEAYRRSRRRIDRITGAWFVCFGARLVAER
jgi:threonine/homoserine/homoserine lactone efflux protein